MVDIEQIYSDVKNALAATGLTAFIYTVGNLSPLKRCVEGVCRDVTGVLPTIAGGIVVTLIALSAIFIIVMTPIAMWDRWTEGGSDG